MFHVFGPVIFLYSQLQKGNAVVSMDKFDLEMIILRGYRVTYLWIVSQMF